MRHACGAQGRADRTAFAGVAREHEHVVVLERTSLVTVYEPPRPRRVGHCADLACDEGPERRERLLSVEPKRVHRRHGLPLAVHQRAARPPALDGLVVDVAREERFGRQAIEERVGRFDQRRSGSVVALETHADAAGGDNLVARAQVRLHVRPAEPVDRLLRVADEKDDARCTPGAPVEEGSPKDRPLRLVGILKLVDERVTPALAHAFGKGSPTRAPERFVDENEHVVEVVTAGEPLAARQLVGHAR